VGIFSSSQRGAFLRCISASIAFIFMLTSSIQAAPGLPFSASPNADLSVSPIPQIEIPSDLGTVKESFAARGAESSLIYLIEDAHANYEAQINIKKLIAYLEKEESIQNAFVEGSDAVLYPDRLRFFSEDAKNILLADHLAQKGEVTGIELFLLENHTTLRAEGVEEIHAYAENLALFRRVMRHWPEADRLFSKLENDILRLGRHVLNRSLREWIRHQHDYENGKSNLLNFSVHLKTYADEVFAIDLAHPSAQRVWPQLTRFTMMVEQRNAMREDALKGEISKLVEVLKSSGADEEMVKGVKSLLAKKNVMQRDAQLRRLWEYVYKEARAYGLDFDVFPMLRRVVAYRVFESEMDYRKLADEISTLGDQLRYALAKTDHEREVVKLMRDMALLRDAFKLSLNGASLKTFLGEDEMMLPSHLAERVNRIARDVFDVEVNAEQFMGVTAVLDTSIEDIRKFYQVAKRREQIMVRNTLSKMKTENIAKAIFITGGFHTEGISHELKKEDIAHIIITPRIKSVNTHRDDYYRVMTGGKMKTVYQSKLVTTPLTGSTRSQIYRLAGAESDAEYRARDIAATMRDLDLIPRNQSQRETLGIVRRTLNHFPRKRAGFGDIAPQTLMQGIDKIAKLLDVKQEEYPRIIETFKTSIDSVTLVQLLTEVSGRSAQEVVDALVADPFFRNVGLEYRIREIQSDPDKTFDERDYGVKSPAEVKVKHDVVTMAKGRIQERREGLPVSDYLRAKREDAKTVPFAFRDEMEKYVGRFLGLEGDYDQEAHDLLYRIKQMETFLSKVNLQEIRYVVTSGIGANEMYSHQLKELVNQFFQAQGIDVKWIVVNNPADLARIPDKANNENTLVFEMSRSGGTKETLDFFNATRDRFKKRVVAANKTDDQGKLYSLARDLSTAQDAHVLNIDDIPGHIGGRQMNRKTLMTYAPLFLALSAGVKDTGKARSLLANYARTLYKSNQDNSYENGLSSIAIQLAENWFRQRTGAGRFKFSVIHDPSLFYTTKEALQLMNEGANTGDNVNILDAYSLDDEGTIKAVFNGDPEHQLPIFLLNKSGEAKHNAIAQRLMASFEKSGIPFIKIEVDLSEGAGMATEDKFRKNLKVLARTTALIQDMVVYFTHITNQDANSNPAVKMVREITGAIFELKGDSILIRDVMDKIDAKNAAEAGYATKEMETREAGVAPLSFDSNPFRPFLDGIVGVASALGADSNQVATAVVSTIDKHKALFDVGEAAGGAKIAMLREVFARTEIGEAMGKNVPTPDVEPLTEQHFLDVGSDMKLSVATHEGFQAATLSDGSTPEKLANYLFYMYQRLGPEAIKYMPLVHMQIDSERPEIKEMIKTITEQFADLGITSPNWVSLPGAAHTGIEGIMSHPKNTFQLAIISKQAHPAPLGTTEISDGVTINRATEVYGISNVFRIAAGGSPSVIFEINDSSQLGEVQDILTEALRAHLRNQKAPIQHMLNLNLLRYANSRASVPWYR